MILQISEWAVQWKMNFNPDPSKQAQELLFSRKTSSKPYPSLNFNDNPVHEVPLQKHLGLFLDPKLSFDEHIQCILIKTRKIIGLIRKLQPIIPRAALLTIYKSFLRPHLDYGDVIYDRAFNESFQNKLESVQYNAALAITGAIRGSSREKLYQELGLESLKSRRWYRKLCLFFKLKKNKHPSYLFDMIPKVLSTRTTRNYNNIPLFNVKHEYFRNSFFPSTVIEWNKLDNNIRNSESVSAFKKQILKFIRPSPNSTFNVHNPHGIKLLTRLRVGLSHLREHKFRHNFQDSLDPFCNCGRHIETTIHFFLHCSNYSNQRKTLFEKISNIKCSLLNQNDSVIAETLLFGLNGLNDKEYMYNRINNRIYYNRRKVPNTIVMNPFNQITTFLEICN